MTTKAITTNADDVQLSNVFATVKSFEAAQRIGNMLAQSVFTPDAFKGKVGDCVIALEMANRMNLPVPMVMQNMYIVYGKPSWSSQFIIGRFNMSGKFTHISYDTNVNSEPDKTKWYCIAKSTVIATGEIIESAKITWQMAEAEGWTKKNGSKWLTMPEQMFRYRAASFLISANAPELKLGIQLQEDVIDGMNTIEVEANVVEPNVVEEPKAIGKTISNEVQNEEPSENEIRRGEASASLFDGVKL